VTGIAGDPTGVICGGNLRKALRFGAVGFMTTRTNDRRIEFWGLYRCRVVGVLRQGSVARLAGDDHMLALFLLIDDLSVAGLARFVARKRNRPGRNLGNGVASIVAVLPETARNNCGAKKDKRGYP
jgi:hypothetical protein